VGFCIHRTAWGIALKIISTRSLSSLLVLLFRSVAIGLLVVRSNGLAVTLLHMSCHLKKTNCLTIPVTDSYSQQSIWAKLVMPLNADDFSVNSENILLEFR